MLTKAFHAALASILALLAGILLDLVAGELQLAFPGYLQYKVALLIALLMLGLLIPREKLTPEDVMRQLSRLPVPSQWRGRLQLNAVRLTGGVLLLAVVGWLVYIISVGNRCAPGTTCVVVAQFPPVTIRLPTLLQGTLRSSCRICWAARNSPSLSGLQWKTPTRRATCWPSSREPYWWSGAPFIPLPISCASTLN